MVRYSEGGALIRVRYSYSSQFISVLFASTKITLFTRKTLTTLLNPLYHHHFTTHHHHCLPHFTITASLTSPSLLPSLPHITITATITASLTSPSLPPSHHSPCTNHPQRLCPGAAAMGCTGGSANTATKFAGNRETEGCSRPREAGSGERQCVLGTQ